MSQLIVAHKVKSSLSLQSQPSIKPLEEQRIYNHVKLHYRRKGTERLSTQTPLQGDSEKMPRQLKFWKRNGNNNDVSVCPHEVTRDYQSVCYPVLLTFLNCLDDAQWRSLRSGIRDPSTRALFATNSKMVVDVAAQTVFKILLPALMGIPELDNTERAALESNFSSQSSSKDSTRPADPLRRYFGVTVATKEQSLDATPSTSARTAPEIGAVMEAIAGSMASVEEHSIGKGQKTVNLLLELGRKMICCHPKSCCQTGGHSSVAEATPPLSPQGSRITLGSVLTQNMEILSDPMFQLTAAKSVSEILRKSSPSPSVSLVLITSVSCPGVNSWSPVSDHRSASRAESVASALVDGFVKDVREVSERFQAEGAAVEREPFGSRVKRDALRLYLSIQTKVRVLLVPVACCAKVPVTPDLPRGESKDKVLSDPQLLQADINLVKMDEEELADEEIERCSNEVLGSLMNACRVAGVVPDQHYHPGVSVGSSPTNDPDLTHYTDRLISALQDHCTSTSPTCELAASEPEHENTQSINNVETTMVPEIHALRKLSSPTFQGCATEKISEVMMRALRTPQLTPQTSRTNIDQTPTPSLDEVDFETESLRLVEAFVLDVETHAQEVAMAVEVEDRAKPSSPDDRVAEGHCLTTGEPSTRPTTKERIASASRSILHELKITLARFFKTGSVSTEELGLTPKKLSDSDNVDEKANMVVWEILDSLKTGLSSKSPSVSSVYSKGAISLEARKVVGEMVDQLENFTSSSRTASPSEEQLAQVSPQNSPVPSRRTSTMANINSPDFRAKAKESVSAALLQSFVDISTLVGPSLTLPQVVVMSLNVVPLSKEAEEVVELFITAVADEDHAPMKAKSMSTAQTFAHQLQDRLSEFYSRVLAVIAPKVKGQSESSPAEPIPLSVSDHFLDTTMSNVVKNLLSSVQELDNSEGEVALTQAVPLVRSETSLAASVMICDILSCLDNTSAVGSSTSLKTLLVPPTDMTETLASETFQTTATQRLIVLLQKCLCSSQSLDAGIAESEPVHGCLEKAAREILDTVVGGVRRMLQGSRCAGKPSIKEVSEEEMCGTAQQLFLKLQEKIKNCFDFNKSAEVSQSGNNTLTRAKKSLSQILVAVRDQEENAHVKALAGTMLDNIEKLPEVKDNDVKEDVESLTLFDAASKIIGAASNESLEGQRTKGSNSRSRLMTDSGSKGSSQDDLSVTATLARLEKLVARGGFQNTTEELVGKLQTLLKSEGSFFMSLPAGKSNSDSILSRVEVRRAGQTLKELTSDLIFSYTEEAVKQLLVSVLIPPLSWGLGEDDVFYPGQSDSSSRSSSPSSDYYCSYDDTVSLYTTVLVHQVISAVTNPSAHSGLVLPSTSAPSSESEQGTWKPYVVIPTARVASRTGLDTGLTGSSFHILSLLTSEDVSADSSVDRNDKATSVKSSDFPAPVVPAKTQKKGLARLREHFNNWKYERAAKKARKLEVTTDSTPIPKDEEASMAPGAPVEVVATSAPCWCVPSSKKEQRNKPHKGLFNAFRESQFCRAIVGCMTQKAS